MNENFVFAVFDVYMVDKSEMNINIIKMTWGEGIEKLIALSYGVDISNVGYFFKQRYKWYVKMTNRHYVDPDELKNLMMKIPDVDRNKIIVKCCMDKSLTNFDGYPLVMNWKAVEFITEIGFKDKDIFSCFEAKFIRQNLLCKYFTIVHFDKVFETFHLITTPLELIKHHKLLLFKKIEKIRKEIIDITTEKYKDSHTKYIHERLQNDLFQLDQSTFGDPLLIKKAAQLSADVLKSMYANASIDSFKRFDINFALGKKYRIVNFVDTGIDEKLAYDLAFEKAFTRHALSVIHAPITYNFCFFRNN
ncbi:hypothetical protein MXB_4271 [Myxobolus squamalis]|nr:hypothetical protein MXB_4271 [Myxobolus squamalis]